MRRDTPFPARKGERGGCLGPPESAMFSLSLGALQKTAGRPGGVGGRGERMGNKLTDGKEGNQETTNVRARGGIAINNHDV